MVPRPYRGYRFPAEVLAKVIEHAAWLHHCFSLRDGGTILAARGVAVGYGSSRR